MLPHKIKKRDYSMIVRNFTFGVEDSLVSTVGLLAGIAVADVPRASIIITGLVLIFVEAFSMGVGSLLSEESVEEYQMQKNASMTQPIIAAVVMFLSYVLAGLIPLTPFFYSSGKNAIISSVVLSMISLFCLGVFNAKMFRTKAWKDGIFTLLMGGIAILVGIAVGKLAGHL